MNLGIEATDAELARHGALAERMVHELVAGAEARHAACSCGPLAKGGKTALDHAVEHMTATWAQGYRAAMDRMLAELGAELDRWHAAGNH